MTRLLAPTPATHAHTHAHTHTHTVPTDRPHRLQEERMARESEDCLRREEDDDEEEEEGGEVEEEKTTQIMDRKQVEGLSLSAEEEEEEEEETEENGAGGEDKEDEEEEDEEERSELLAEEEEEEEERVTQIVERKRMCGGTVLLEEENEKVEENGLGDEKEEDDDKENGDDEEEREEESHGEELEEGGSGEVEEVEWSEEVCTRSPEENYQRKWIIDERQKTEIFKGKLLESDAEDHEGSGGGGCVSESEDADEDRGGKAKEDETEDTEEHGDGLSVGKESKEEADDSKNGDVPSNASDDEEITAILKNGGVTSDAEKDDTEEDHNYTISEDITNGAGNRNEVPNCTTDGDSTVNGTVPTCAVSEHEVVSDVSDEGKAPNCATSDDNIVNGVVDFVTASTTSKGNEHCPEGGGQVEHFPGCVESACGGAEAEESLPDSTSASEAVCSASEEDACGRASERRGEGVHSAAGAVADTPQHGRDAAAGDPTGAGSSPADTKEGECVPASVMECNNTFDGLTESIYAPNTDFDKNTIKQIGDALESNIEERKGVPKSSVRNSHTSDSDKGSSDSTGSATDNGSAPDSTNDCEVAPKNGRHSDHSLESAWDIKGVPEGARDVEGVPETVRAAEDLPHTDGDDENCRVSDGDGEYAPESGRDDEHVSESTKSGTEVPGSERDGEDGLEVATDIKGVPVDASDTKDVPEDAADSEGIPENARNIDSLLESTRNFEHVPTSFRNITVLQSSENTGNVPVCATNTECVLGGDVNTYHVPESGRESEDILESDTDSEDVLQGGNSEDIPERIVEAEDILESARDGEDVVEDSRNGDGDSVTDAEHGTQSARIFKDDPEGANNGDVSGNIRDFSVTRISTDHEDVPDDVMKDDNVPKVMMDCVDVPHHSGDREGTTNVKRAKEGVSIGEVVHTGGGRSVSDSHALPNGEDAPDNARDRRCRTHDAGHEPVPIFERGALPANEGGRRLATRGDVCVATVRRVEGDAWPIRVDTERRRGSAGEGRREAGEGWIPRRARHKDHVEQQVADPLACLRQRPAPLPGPRCTCGNASSPWRARFFEESLGCMASEQQQEAVSQRQLRDLTLSLAAAAAEEAELTSQEHKSLSDLHEVRRRDHCGGSKRSLTWGVNSSPGRAIQAHTVPRPAPMRGVYVPGGGPLGFAPPQTLALAPSDDGSRISASCYTLCGPPRPSGHTGRKGVRSCILPEGSFFPNPSPCVPLPGTLRSRVHSEPNVSGRLVSPSSPPPRLATPRGLSQLFSSRRKSIASCIYPATADEDALPYVKTGAPAIPRGSTPTRGSTAGLQDRQGLSSPTGDWESPRQGCCGPSPLCPAPRFVATDPRPRQARAGRRRPQSLVIIPETQMAWAPEPATAAPEVLSRPEWGSQRLASPGEPLPPEERRRLYRGSGRSWSFTPADRLQPVRAQPSPRDAATKAPRRTASLRGLFTSSSLRSPDVIFPWRRGEPTRSSGRCSPAPFDGQSQPQSAPPCPSQSSISLRPEEATTNGEARSKDSVWWRGRPGSGGSGGGGGGTRTARKEKASSSPAFRRASLSHSEWDIRSRPWSHVYSEQEAAKLSQSVCRLAVTSCEERGVEVPAAGVDEMGPSSLPLMPSSSTSSSSTHIASSSEGSGVFQKFKKSLSLRLARKGSKDGTPTASTEPPEHPEVHHNHHNHHNHDPPPPHQPLPRRWGSFSRDDDPSKAATTFLFGHPLFRSSKERRRARLRDARATKCNSADSGDSGIELVTGSGHVTTPQTNDLDLFGSSGVDSALTASLADEGSGSGSSGDRLREPNPRAVRRTHSDVGGRGATCYSRQMSTPQPIKVRPAHRLPQHNTASLHRAKSVDAIPESRPKIMNSLKRSKGSSHLRRSISQPLDLDKTTSNSYNTPTSSLRRCRSPDDVPASRHQRRPSAGDILNDENTTSEDEIGMSDSEDFRGDLKRSLDEDDNQIVYAEALWDHVTLDAEELVFKAGDLITVIDSGDKDWWWGRISTRAGWFPAAFVRILVNQEDHQSARNHQDPRNRGPARKLSISGLSHDQIRTNVINEIISTERDFVKHLRDVIKGYLMQVCKRGDMFSKERIATIFGNMEALYHFQSGFLKELEECIDWQEPHKSCIGAIFIRNREKFEIYSEYCNNHPAATSALQELYQDQRYVHFFEACRLLQEMIDISLDGFLLTPVQKICKYPLQLQELLKYTKTDHPDYSSVKGALEAMRDVALLVNERKRRMECLEKIASWQMTVEGWEGPDLLEESSQLIHQGEVTKGAGGAWPKDVTLFLFDHQLVYCKRDLLKRNTFVYRGRLNLDMCEVVDMPANKDSSFNMSNGWKIHSVAKNKWYTFSCKTNPEKLKWMEAFRKERALVAADESAGFVVGEKAKNLARVAARNQRNRPKRPRTTKTHKRVQAMTYAQAELLVNLDPDSRSNSLPSGVQAPEGKKKGTWFSFGGHKKGRGSGRTLGQIQHHPV
ncbi:uncharacterized protein LOC135089167 isoform X2 [Scylla paramamosain]|uniref:uncharacterized protein LOC135089167 isoform X2 n=1 Tax=Scylla paramamosain TaxID=85552 RepID=UPI003083807E